MKSDSQQQKIIILVLMDRKIKASLKSTIYSKNDIKDC